MSLFYLSAVFLIGFPVFGVLRVLPLDKLAERIGFIEPDDK